MNEIIRQEDLIDYLVSPSSYKSDFITLPNALVALWTSYGFPFHVMFDLDKKDGIDGLTCWWLKNQHTLPHISDVVKNYFLQYHIVNIDAISVLMQLIWDQRKDLQAAFPDPKGANRTDYWGWWLSSGYKEFNIPPIRLSLLEEYETFLFDILWKNRQDLQAAFPDPKGANRTDYWGWWELHGQNEYQIARQEQSSNNKMYTKSKKIALIGHPTGTFGLGEDARLIAESLTLLGYDVDSYVANPNINIAKENHINTKSLGEYSHDYLCNIFCLPAFDMIGLAFEYGLDLFTSTYNIAIWQWELPIFPKQAEFAFHLVHKPLAISNFTAQSIAKSYGRPIETLPLPVKQNTFEPKTRQYFNLPDGFMFFFSFDRNSFIERKNPLGVIEAFQRTFTENENVILVVKAMGSIPSQIWNECKRKALCDIRIYLLEDVLNKNDYTALIDLSDAIISLHRAEGFGRLMAEAFLLEKPVIVSNYSGNLDYTSSENSYLIDGMVIPIYENEYLFSNNNFWFHPDLNQASHAMREVFSDPEHARKKGKNGKKLIKENYSLEATGKFLKQFIDILIKGKE